VYPHHCSLTGLKYASENESDLKDKMDFPENEPHHFPPGGKLLDPKVFLVLIK